MIRDYLWSTMIQSLCKPMFLFLIAAVCSGCGNDGGMTGKSASSHGSSCCWEWISRDDYIGSGASKSDAEFKEYKITSTTEEGSGGIYRAEELGEELMWGGVLVCWVPITEPVTYYLCMRDYCHWILSVIENYEPDSMTVAAEKEYWRRIRNKVADAEDVKREWRFRWWKKYAETVYTQSQLNQHKGMMDQQAELWDFSISYPYELTDSPADVNEDGIVDVSDLLIVVGSWGECE